MATTTIGTASRTYATWAAWNTYVNALDLTTGGPETANPYNDSEFAVAGTVSYINFGNVNSTNFVTVIPPSGQSFFTNSNVRTNALYYNASNGVGLNDTATSTGSIAFRIASASFTVVTGLQIISSDNGQLFYSPADALHFSNCIFVGPKLESAGNSLIFNNCLFVKTAADGANHIWQFDSGSITFNFCTFISNPSTAYYVNYAGATTASFVNCAFFGGGTTAFHNGTPTSETFTNCMTDITGTTGLTGGLTFANQFVSTSNDFRAKAGANLANAGVTVSGITTDISGFTRNATTPTVGAWELSGTLPPNDLLILAGGPPM